MSSLKVIKGRIRSVSNTKKISQTMKLVSVAKFTRAEKTLEAIRPFGNSVQIFFDLIEINNTLTASTEPDLVIAMSGDRGLCGAVHSGIAKAASGTLGNEKQDINDNVKLICIGEKNRTILSRIFSNKILWVASEIGKKPPTFGDASFIAGKIIKSIDEHAFMQAQFYFNKFINTGIYSVATANIFNRSVIYATPKYSTYDMVDDEIMDSWLEFSTTAMIFWMLNEGIVSELSARITAMDGATKNATEMIKNFTLEYNRTRQAVITKELIEIISGASAT